MKEINSNTQIIKVVTTCSNHLVYFIYREGEEWRKSRSVIDKKLLKMKDIAAYSDRMNQVISDLITYIKRKQKEDTLNGEIADLSDAIYKWSFECKILLDMNHLEASMTYIIFCGRFISDIISLEMIIETTQIRCILHLF